MKNLLETLIEEGLLSDLEDNMKAGDNMADEYILKQWFTNDKCKLWKRRKGWILAGNFKMNFEGEVYDGPKIKKVDGNLSIYKSGLVTLENIFTDDAEITGQLTIEDNDNLISLRGLPTTINSVTIAGNKKLTDIDVVLNVNGNAYISKNGKKFSKDELSKKMNVSKNIFCSVEPYDVVLESEALMEAFKAPQLKLIWDGIKAASQDVGKEERVSFNDITRLEWDKLDASNITELDAKDPKCEKLIRAYCSNKVNGIIVTMNDKGEPLKIYRNKNVIIIHPKLREYAFTTKWNKKLTRFGVYSKCANTSSIIASLSQWDNYTGSNNEYTVFKVDSVLFIEIPEELRLNYYKKVSDRHEARKGALALMRGKERTGEYRNDKAGVSCYGEEIDYKQIRYFQDIANENRERYKQAIIKIRAEKAMMTDTFKTLKDRIDKIFDRYTELLDKILKNPKKYFTYDVKYLNKKISYQSSSYRRYSEESGLMQNLDSYTRLIINASNGNGSSNIKNEIKTVEQIISNKIVDVENELARLESK